VTGQAEDLARPWFERWPELLDWELGRFAHHGLPARIDEGRRTAGQLVIESEVSFGGEPLAIEIAYPAEYPELPPWIFGPPGLLERHQHRFGGTFCLLPRPLDDWPARDWGAADLVAERLTALLADSEVGPERVRDNEAPMPEPVSSYFAYALDACVLLHAEATPPDTETEGSLRIRRATPHLFVVEGGVDRSAPDSFLQLFPLGRTIDASWRRLPAAPLAGPGPQELLTWIREQHPQLLTVPAPPPPPNSKRPRKKPPTLEMCAFVFPEEGPGVGEMRDAWLFLVIDRSSGTEAVALLHSEVVSEDERARRLSELDGLNEKHIVVVGLGTLGGPVAIELARAGVGKLDLIDYERHEFGNTTRHPLGTEYVGLPKTHAVMTACRRANPFCGVGIHHLRLGDPHWNGESTVSRLAGIAEEADLIVDATGSHQVAQFLGRLASEAGAPLVASWMTDGFYGAEVVRIAPGRTCCWGCFATSHRLGERLCAEAGPPSDVIVQGCSHPTTVGAGFDAAEVAAITTRVAVQTVAPAGGYPDAGWDHAALSFRRCPDDSEMPRFQAEVLVPREECERCQAYAGVPTTP
jgi:molybdopterin/thiamine biosynthesis adenylyltransferase